MTPPRTSSVQARLPSPPSTTRSAQLHPPAPAPLPIPSARLQRPRRLFRPRDAAATGAARRAANATACRFSAGRPRRTRSTSRARHRIGDASSTARADSACPSTPPSQSTRPHRSGHSARRAAGSRPLQQPLHQVALLRLERGLRRALTEDHEIGMAPFAAPLQGSDPDPRLFDRHGAAGHAARSKASSSSAGSPATRVRAGSRKSAVAAREAAVRGSGSTVPRRPAEQVGAVGPSQAAGQRGRLAQRREASTWTRMLRRLIVGQQAGWQSARIAVNRADRRQAGSSP